MTVARVLDEFPVELREPVLNLYELIKSELGITREEFTELKDLVGKIAEAQLVMTAGIDNLAEAQGRTEIRMEELAEAQGRTEIRMEELAEAQGRTEIQMKELAAAQNRTEARVEELAEAQGRTEARMDKLSASIDKLAEAQGRTEARMEELAAAQNRTEARVEELAEAQSRTEARVDTLSLAIEKLAAAQTRTEEQMRIGFTRVHNSIAALGSRWGIMAESTFRTAIRALLARTGYTVENGYYGDREVDIICRNGDHIMIEITSAFRKSDIPKLLRSAKDYEEKMGVYPKLMVAAIHIGQPLMRMLDKEPRQIEIFTYDPDELLEPES